MSAKDFRDRLHNMHLNQSPLPEGDKAALAALTGEVRTAFREEGNPLEKDELGQLLASCVTVTRRDQPDEF